MCLPAPPCWPEVSIFSFMDCDFRVVSDKPLPASIRGDLLIFSWGFRVSGVSLWVAQSNVIFVTGVRKTLPC